MRRRRLPARALTVALVIAATAAQCGGDAATPTAPATGQAAATGAGAWAALGGSATPSDSSLAGGPAFPGASALPDASTPDTSFADPDDEAQASNGGTSGDTAASTPVPDVSAPSQPRSGRLPGEPDAALTPGALNPDVTQATISSTICISGWTATVRPPTSYTTPLKIKQIAQYGYSDTRTASYEEDHLISLELGGAPADPRNLWPEPYAAALADGTDVGAHVKDRYENQLHAAVCSGAMTLAAARTRIGDDWVHYMLGLPLGATGAPGPAKPAPAQPPAAKPGPTPRPSSQAFGGALSVRFTSLPNPARDGTVASMSATTKPGAVCSAKVVWPSGTVSAARGLQVRPTAGSDGVVSWSWNVASTTKPGTARASVTCSLGASTGSATATFTLQ